MNRKELKSSARKSLKRHYLIFVLLCIVISWLGTGGDRFINIFTAKNDNAVLEIDGGSIEVRREVGNNITLRDVVDKFMAGDLDASQEDVVLNTLMEQYQESEHSDSPALQRQRGVLADLVNQYSSGSFAVKLLYGIVQITHSPTAAVLLAILLGLILTFLITVFVINVYDVTVDRLFLEGRVYEKLPGQRLLFLMRVKCWIRASLTIFVKDFFLVLWSLTIIGGFIKLFSYSQVNYIVAENPRIKAREAVTLSRQMMKGHKWELFVLYLSFIPWGIVDFLTAGIAGIFYVKPYIRATRAEYYTALRKQTLDNGNPLAEKYLIDKYLFEKASEELLRETYPEIIGKDLTEAELEPYYKGVKGFVLKNFGLSLSTKKVYEAFNAKQDEILLLDKYKTAVNGYIYPGRLYPISERDKANAFEMLKYTRCYSLPNMTLIFFTFMIIGWIFEVIMGYAQGGGFTNRGFLHGPWLPIYGVGGAVMLTLLYRLRKHPAIFFVVAIVLSGTIEYTTATVLEITRDGEKWWDYSGYFLNLNGRICAEGLLAFGIMGMAITFLIAPVFDNFLNYLYWKARKITAIILLIAFGIDIVYSTISPNTGEGVTTVTALVCEQAGDGLQNELRDDVQDLAGIRPELSAKA